MPHYTFKTYFTKVMITIEYLTKHFKYVQFSADHANMAVSFYNLFTKVQNVMTFTDSQVTEFNSDEQRITIAAGDILFDN